MLRSLIVLALTGVAAHAAILPEKFGPYTRTEVSSPGLEEQALWHEYGLSDHEQAGYTGPRSFTVSAWRFTDPTGAAAAFDWQRPANSSASRVNSLAAVYPGGELVVFGNYLLKIDGWQPDDTDLVPLAKVLPKVNRSSLPILRGYLPDRNRIPNSDRYILGPTSLKAFAPEIPDSDVAFHLSAEAETARYRTPGGEIAVTLVMYPTPQIARERLTAFQRLERSVVNRSGPIVMIATSVPKDGSAAGAGLNPQQTKAANALLGKIDYRPEFMIAEAVHEKKENIGEMVLAIMTLAGILIAAAGIMGLLFGGFRIFGKKFGMGPAEESFTALNLSGK